MPDGQNFTAPPPPALKPRGISALPQSTTPTRPTIPPSPASTVHAPRRQGRKRKLGSTLPPLPPAVIREHGLEHRLAMGQIEVERGAIDPDRPEHPIAGRPRAVCSYRAMLAAGGITQLQAVAADRYAMLVEVESGGRWSPGERVGSPADSRPWEREGAAPTQLQAIVSLRDIHRVVGPAARGILVLGIVDNLNAEGMGKRLKRDPRAAAGVFSAALARLAEHFDEVDAAPQKKRHTIRDPEREKIA